MVPEIEAAGKAAAEALAVVENELASVKMKPDQLAQLNISVCLIDTALTFLRTAYKRTREYTLLRDRAEEASKKGGKNVS